MALVLDATYRNRSSANGEDHLGRIYIELAAALVASGFWRRKNQGDGQSEYSSGTSTLFTANGGLGYATSGAWNTAVANSISYPKAYIHLGEYVDGAFTGREMLLQRGSSAVAGADRNAVLVFAWEPFTGTPNATTAPTRPTKSHRYRSGDPNSSGVNIFVTLATSPQMGGSGGVIYHNVWVCDAPGGTTADVCPFWLEVYDGDSDEPAFCVGYESLRRAAAADDHPCVVSFPNTTGATWEFGQTVGASPLSHSGSTGSGSLYSVSSADGTSVEQMAMVSYRTPDGTTRPGSATEISDDVSSEYPILPCYVWSDVNDTSPAAIKGVCENLETLFPTANHLWPTTLFSLVAHATERPRVSFGHVLAPWEVGVSRGGLTASNRTDLRTVYEAITSPDTTAPVIGGFSPAAGAVAYTQAITVPISDNLDELLVYELWAEFAGRPDERVWSGGAFSSDYSTSSALSGGNLVVRRDAGWPAAFTLKARAYDEDGNVSNTGSAAYTISTSPNPAAADTGAPTVTLVSPTDGNIGKNEPYVIDVYDFYGLARCILYVKWGAGLAAPEFAYDTKYPSLLTGYTVVKTEPAANTWRFTIARKLGWTVPPELEVAAFDLAGNNV